MSPQKNYFFKLIFFCETSSPSGHLTLNVVVTYAQRPFLSHFYVQETLACRKQIGIRTSDRNMELISWAQFSIYLASVVGEPFHFDPAPASQDDGSSSSHVLHNFLL